MIAFGLHDNMLTDPQMIQGLMTELKLNDLQTANQPMQTFFEEVVAKPQKLQPILRNIRRGILAKHPAIVEFAEVALEKNWFRPSEQVIRTIHVAFILEALTAGMCNNHHFFLEVQKHYQSHEKILGIDSKHLLSTFWHALEMSHDIFGSFKALSVDPAMIYFHTQHDQLKEERVKKLLQKHQINYMEYKLLPRCTQGVVLSTSMSS